MPFGVELILPKPVPHGSCAPSDSSSGQHGPQYSIPPAGLLAVHPPRPAHVPHFPHNFITLSASFPQDYGRVIGLYSDQHAGERVRKQAKEVSIWHTQRTLRLVQWCLCGAIPSSRCWEKRCTPLRCGSTVCSATEPTLSWTAPMVRSPPLRIPESGRISLRFVPLASSH